MKPIVKNLLIVITIIIVLAVICVCIFIFTLFPLKTPKIIMEKELIENKEAIISVVNYLKEVPFETAVIDNDFDKDIDLFVYNDNGSSATHLSIEGTVASDNIYFLFKKCNYENITKDGDAISFLRWAGLESGAGIVYSIDGHTPDESSFDFLTKLEPLGEKNWYYYEEDYNEWKKRNSQ